MSARDIAEALDDLAGRIAKLSPTMTRDPHAFYEKRSEAAGRSRAIAEWVRTGRKPPEFEGDRS
jgi:hypothetical protein